MYNLLSKTKKKLKITNFQNTASLSINIMIHLHPKHQSDTK